MTTDRAARARRELRLLAITDLAVADASTTIAAVEEIVDAVPAGSFAVGVRDHHASIARRLDLARALRAVTRDKALLLVFDCVDVARAAGADGVHLGRRSLDAEDARAILGTGAVVGRSCHDAEELAGAARQGVDFVTLSPLFGSPGKGAPLGEKGFALLAASQPALRVLALGGVDGSNARVARGCGAMGAAAIRAIFGSPRPGVAAARMVEAFDDA